MSWLTAPITGEVCFCWLEQCMLSVNTEQSAQVVSAGTLVTARAELISLLANAQEILRAGPLVTGMEGLILFSFT